MKSFKNKDIKACECGSVEFITKPNQYDVYEIIDGKPEFVHSEEVYDKIVLYCRECGKELKNATNYI
ncbi:MAG: hypothetical protein LBR28_00715 [Bacteroidales bacterium]|jgi:hypothetical protein|nr:hypothetical protein [Bacteroidales bacterium]